MNLESITRRNALKGVAGLIGGLVLPGNAEATEVFPFENSMTRNGVKIETDGEGYLTTYNAYDVADSKESANVSLGGARHNYRVCMYAPEGRNISIELPKNNQYGGIDTRFGKFKMTVHGPGTAEIIKRNNFVPLINVNGRFNINAGKYVDLHAWDDYDGGNALDETGVSVNSSGDFRSPTPAFQVNPHDKLGRIIGNSGSPENYFVDFYGEANKVVCKTIRENGRPAIIYVVNILDNKELYLPTKAFALLKDKERFWMRTSYDDQSRMRYASYNELQKYAGPITQFERKIIQEHWERVFKEKKRMEEELSRKTGQIAIVHPVGFYMTEEEILNGYYKRK